MSKQRGFSMVGGTGETSYANNSIPQKTVIRKIRPLLEESVRLVFRSTSPELLNIADLGCSSGPNTLAVLQSIIDVVISTTQSSDLRIPEVNVFLNDLPDNDFNSIFKSLPSFIKTIEENNGVESPCFVSGMPGSFYGRLFPHNFMHLMHSSTCLHWISQVPKGLMGGDNGKESLNKGCIYATKSSHPEILKCYREQFAKDFTMFLRCRSDEMVHGGHIVVSLVVTLDDEPCPLMELVSKALYKLASEGRIDKENLDGFNLPYYRPTIQQVKQVIRVEKALALHKLETFPVSWVASIAASKNQTTQQDHTVHPCMVAVYISRAIRALVETLLVNAFGEEIVDDVFRLVQGMVMNNLATGEEMEVLVLAVSLVKGGLRN